jgi:anthranilate/para-aminobenzoate synthase component I
MSTNSNRPSSYTKLSYIQKVSRINRKLRNGDITNVAATTGFSTTHVSDVIAGKYFNDKIVNEAYDVTRGRISNAVKLSSLMA